MSDFLPPVVLPIEGAIGDLIKALAEANVAIRTWAETVPNTTASIEPAMSGEGHRAGDAFVTGLVDEVDKGTHRASRTVTDRLRDDRGRFIRAGEDAADGFGLGFLRNIGRHLHNAFSGGGGGGGAFSGIGGIFAGVGKGVTKFLIPFGVLPSLIGSLVGALAPLAATLAATVGSLGVLPAMAVGAAVGLGALMVALHGVGGAISAGFSGDLQKYGEAMAKLAPSAQHAVRAIVGLKPQLTALRIEVQQNMFAGMGKEITALGNTYLPILRGELGKVSAGIGAMIRESMGLTRVDGYVDSVRETLKNLRTSIVNASHGFVGFLSGLNDLVNIGSKFGPSAGAWIGSLGDKFSEFMGRVAGSGELQQWIRGGIDALKSLGPFLKDTGSLVASLFRAMGASGQGATGVIGSLMHSLAVFSKSPEGAAAWTSVFKILGQLAGLFGQALMAVLPIAARLLTVLDPLVSTVFAALSSVLQSVATALGPVLDALMPIVDLLAGQLIFAVQGLTPLLDQFAGMLGDVLTQTLKALLPLFVQLLPVFQDLASKWFPEMVPLIASLGDLFMALMPALIPLVDLLVDILIPTMEAFGPITIFMVRALVWLIDALTATLVPIEKFYGWLYKTLDSASMWRKVGTWFAETWHDIANAFDVGVKWIEAIPGRIWAALKTLPRILGHAAQEGIHRFAYAIGFGLGVVTRGLRELPGRVWHIITTMWNGAVRLTTAGINALIGWVSKMPERIGHWFTASKDKAIIQASSMVSSVVAFIRALPGRAWDALKPLPGKIKDAVVDAGKWLYDAGKDVVRGLMDGMASMWHNAIDFIKGLGHDMAKGFKDAMGIGSPSKVFASHGVNIVAGLVHGINTNRHQAINAASRMLAGVANTGTMGGTSGYNTTGGGGSDAGHVPIIVNLGGTQMAAVHAKLIRTTQRYKLRTGTTGLA